MPDSSWPHGLQLARLSWSFTIPWSLLRLMIIESVILSNHLILCHPLLLPSIFFSIRVFSNESALCIRWPKYWSFSISPSNEYSAWFPLRLTVLLFFLSKGVPRVFPSTTIQKHQFFSPQPSLWFNLYLYMTTALTLRTFASKVISLLFNMLSRFVIAFLPRSKSAFSWLQSPSTGILQPNKMKSVTASIFSPSVCHEVMGQDAMILVFWMFAF